MNFRTGDTLFRLIIDTLAFAIIVALCWLGWVVI